MRAALAEFDENVRREGFRRLCGVDEAGRGPLAGPVVAAAVVFSGCEPVVGVNDSKKLTAKRRAELEAELRACGAEIGVGVAEPKEIDDTDILSATFAAMLRAIEVLSEPPDFILVDGSNRIRGLSLPQSAIVKGDGRSASIAAASIIAKVHRDSLMRQYAEKYPGYGFEDHSGYGTAGHLSAIARLGPSPIHRITFRGVREHVSGVARNGTLFPL